MHKAGAEGSLEPKLAPALSSVRWVSRSPGQSPPSAYSVRSSGAGWDPALSVSTPTEERAAYRKAGLMIVLTEALRVLGGHQVRFIAIKSLRKHPILVAYILFLSGAKSRNV